MLDFELPGNQAYLSTDVEDDEPASSAHAQIYRQTSRRNGDQIVDERQTLARQFGLVPQDDVEVSGYEVPQLHTLGRHRPEHLASNNRREHLVSDHRRQNDMQTLKVHMQDCEESARGVMLQDAASVRVSASPATGGHVLLPPSAFSLSACAPPLADTRQDHVNSSAAGKKVYVSFIIYWLTLPVLEKTVALNSPFFFLTFESL